MVIFTPPFSIVCPVYGVDDFLPACIESVMAQTFQDWELLLVDDGSPDSSGTICDEYASRDNRIHVFHGKNEGVSAARNIGMENAAGRYVVFLDGDDRLQANTLEVLYAALQKSPAADVLQFGLLRVSPRACPPSPVVSTADIHSYSSEDYVRQRLFGVTAGGECVSMRLIHRLGLRFRTGVNMAEDQLFVLEALANSREVCKITAPLYLYTTNPIGGIHRGRIENIKRTLEEYDRLVERYPCFREQRDLMALNFAMIALRRGLCGMKVIKRDILPAERLRAIRLATIANKSDRLFHRLSRMNYTMALWLFRLLFVLGKHVNR